jgi:hypothetical protein
MSAVVADPIAEQTGTDTQFDFFHVQILCGSIFYFMNMARSIINNQSCSSGKVRVMVLAGLIPACAQMTDVANDHET